ncbi:hypothetical protein EV378_4776 [Pseudonocardia endophytica]|uniref:Response regulatory domain-containing protein n=1 Tax=Pseudonocardia endophytica TaxID=401976 RepID=A0A4R1HTR3_PSEEN|nr:hypothetical protein EV378_4776 [Pseudonocardia endophytica]
MRPPADAHAPQSTIMLLPRPDYLVKPFSPGELAARARSVLRRSAPPPAAEPTTVARRRPSGPPRRPSNPTTPVQLNGVRPTQRRPPRLDGTRPTQRRPSRLDGTRPNPTAPIPA